MGKPVYDFCSGGRESTFGRVGSRRLFYEFTSDIHFTVMVIFLDTTGGLNG